MYRYATTFVVRPDEFSRYCSGHTETPEMQLDVSSYSFLTYPRYHENSQKVRKLDFYLMKNALRRIESWILPVEDSCMEV